MRRPSRIRPMRFANTEVLGSSGRGNQGSLRGRPETGLRARPVVHTQVHDGLSTQEATLNPAAAFELTGMVVSPSHRRRRVLAATVFIWLATFGQSEAAPWNSNWSLYQDEKGTAVPYPAAIFTVRAIGGTPMGQILSTGDGRARLHIFSFPNERNESPAQFIKRVIVDDRRRLAYERVTSNFFVFSAAENNLILYRRCNFARDGNVHCIDLRYPRSEKLAWDDVVSRISASLRPQ